MIEKDIVYNNIILRIICPLKYYLLIEDLLYGHVIFMDPINEPIYTLHISDENIIRNGLYEKLVDKWFNNATADCYIDNSNRICYLNNINADTVNNKELFIQYFSANVLNRLVEMNGFIAVHSSCVEKSNNGIIFVAGRNSGKTISMLNMLNYGYNIVTNDKSAIGIIDDNIIDYGIAQDVSIRLSKSFTNSKENKKYVDLAKKMNILFKEENQLEGNNLKIKDIDLAKLNGVDISMDTQLCLLIHPLYNPTIKRPNFIKLNKEESRDIIISQLLPLVHETKSFLKNIHYKNEIIPDKEFIIDIFSCLPSYVVEQNEYTTKEYCDKLMVLSLK